jgi:hypothetical protein
MGMKFHFFFFYEMDLIINYVTEIRIIRTWELDMSNNCQFWRGCV